MRIGLVLDRFFEPTRGGREQWTFGFAQRLIERGHEVHVVSREFGRSVLELPLTIHHLRCKKLAMLFADRVPEISRTAQARYRP